MDAFLRANTPGRDLEAWERESIEDVLDGALAVRNKTLSLTEFMRMGIVEYQDRGMDRPMPSPRYTRWLATGLGSRTDPRWQALQKILDWTVRKQHIVTEFGVMSVDDMHLHDAAIRFLRGATLTHPDQSQAA